MELLDSTSRPQSALGLKSALPDLQQGERRTRELWTKCIWTITSISSGKTVEGLHYLPTAPPQEQAFATSSTPGTLKIKTSNFLFSTRLLFLAPFYLPGEKWHSIVFKLIDWRRLISQRSSLETLEDIEENAPLRRCRTLSGSPRPKNFKKIHFIKNMRQHDTRNGRDLKVDGGRQSAGTMSLKEIIGLEGVELGADGKTVSYTQFLLPTNAFGARRNTIDSTSSFSQFHNLSHRSLSIGRASSTQGSLDTGSDLGESVDYDPNLLDDPQWPCGKHKRVLIFPSYMTTVIDYVKPSDLKKDMNETFKEKFPHIKLTLSKIRSLKREMRKLAQEDCGFEEPTVAMAFVYFEKLALKGKLNKQNRKLCAGACMLLAAKIGSDLKKHEVKHLIDVSGLCPDG
ncbi:CDK5 and ABL1 enzyme substrate 1 [Fukomys damarensis]|uniref:CDK5 and ABL1 enzyme substrate 1 n=1 Tax=Fukomys damarensis TaxID=885580 RepID=A0A091D9G2_FUKDA|nr:CDK5 and ABL1 enzyme substrate 1 [Fukomys damarensis]